MPEANGIPSAARAADGVVFFRYTPADYVDAFRLGGSLTRKHWAVVAISLAAYAVVTFLLLPAASASMLLAMIVGALLAWRGLHSAFYVPWLARRVFTRSPIALRDQRLELLPDGLRFASERSDATLLWRDFIRWRSDRATTLIYIGPRQFHLFPARLADLGFPIEALHAELLEHVGPLGRRRIP